MSCELEKKKGKRQERKEKVAGVLELVKFTLQIVSSKMNISVTLAPPARERTSSLAR